jgi:hypothetical protein
MEYCYQFEKLDGRDRKRGEAQIGFTHLAAY